MELGSQVPVGESPRQKAEDQQGRERLDTRVEEAQAGDALPVHRHRSGHPRHRVFADRAVVADALDAEQASVGREADLRNAGRLCSRLPIPKSRVSLMVVSVRSARPSL
jgi:hypothetical protein